MKKVLILVEGQTEQSFVKRILSPYFLQREIALVPTILTTKIVKSGANFKGGITTYKKFEKEVLTLTKDSSAKVVTTMVDYYGLSSDFPGYSKKNKIDTCYKRVEYLEKKLKKSIKNKKFIPYLQLHEFESLLFSDPKVIDNVLFGKISVNSAFMRIREEFSSPEEIDDAPDTHPSQRILNECSSYEKIFHGQTISEEIGLKKIISECKHFASWIGQLSKV